MFFANFTGCLTLHRLVLFLLFVCKLLSHYSTSWKCRNYFGNNEIYFFLSHLLECVGGPLEAEGMLMQQLKIKAFVTIIYIITFPDKFTRIIIVWNHIQVKNWKSVELTSTTEKYDHIVSWTRRRIFLASFQIFSKPKMSCFVYILSEHYKNTI